MPSSPMTALTDSKPACISSGSDDVRWAGRSNAGNTLLLWGHVIVSAIGKSIVLELIVDVDVPDMAMAGHEGRAPTNVNKVRLSFRR